ncbi:MAG: hypothetical protein QW478_00665 [Candidatus Micrarchaeaceae archaeon]
MEKIDKKILILIEKQELKYIYKNIMKKIKKHDDFFILLYGKDYKIFEARIKKLVNKFLSFDVEKQKRLYFKITDHIASKIKYQFYYKGFDCSIKKLVNETIDEIEEILEDDFIFKYCKII